MSPRRGVTIDVADKGSGYCPGSGSGGTHDWVLGPLARALVSEKLTTTIPRPRSLK